MGARTDDGGRLEAHRRRLVDGFAERQLGAVSTAPSSRRPTGGAVLGWLVAAPVNLLGLALAAAGVALVVGSSFGFFRLAGVAMVFCAYAVSPVHVGRRRPPRGVPLSTYPALHEVVRQVGVVTGAPLPDRVVLSTRFNASVSGRRGRRVLELGAPLWTAAPRQARVALLGHELGHLAHRDLTRSRWVRWALGSAQAWWSVLNQTGGRTRGYGRNRAQTRLVEAIFLAPLAYLATGYLYLLDSVNASAHRRQEYLADLDAVAAGGTDGALALMDALLARDAVDAATTRARAAGPGTDVWTEIAATTGGVDEAARQRRRALAETQRSRIDDSHPRTSLRIRLVQSRPWTPAAVVPDAGTWARIDAELQPAMARVAAAVRSSS